MATERVRIEKRGYGWEDDADWEVVEISEPIKALKFFVSGVNSEYLDTQNFEYRVVEMEVKDIGK